MFHARAGKGHDDDGYTIIFSLNERRLIRRYAPHDDQI
jgi:hypothetical protein